MRAIFFLIRWQFLEFTINSEKILANKKKFFKSWDVQESLDLVDKTVNKNTYNEF